MQDLKLQTTLPALSFDAKALKAWALSLTEKYMGLVVTEETVADAKKDMAELNRAKKSIDDARKEAVRRVSEPIRAFEAQIKEVCAIFDTAYQGLSRQVKAFEDAQREAKRKDVAGLIIEANMNAFGEPAFLDIPMQDKWLNKTTSLKSIRKDIAAIIERHMEEEQRRKALEQAKRDRIASIESLVHSLNERHGFDFSVSSFVVGQFMNMDTPVAEVLKRIESVFKDEQTRRDLLKNVEQKSASVEQPAPKTEQPAAPDAPDKVMSVLLTYAPANEQSVRATLEQLRKLCSSFSVRTR